MTNTKEIRHSVKREARIAAIAYSKSQDPETRIYYDGRTCRRGHMHTFRYICNSCCIRCAAENKLAQRAREKDRRIIAEILDEAGI